MDFSKGGGVDLDWPEIEFGIENEDKKKNGIEVVGISAKWCKWSFTKMSGLLTS